jgi:DNA-binding Lrp family transcriptional regulator
MKISMLTDKEKKIAAYIQKDISLVKEPFKEAACELGMTEGEIIAATESLMEKGFIRKFAAILRHQKAGYTRNMMVIWAVPEERCDDVGAVLAGFPQVTHCYRRTPAFEGKYNIFTMVHLHDENDGIVDCLAHASGIHDYKALVSEEEYKKSSMEYF